MLTIKENKYYEYFDVDLCRVCMSDESLVPLIVAGEDPFDNENSILSVFILCTGLDASWGDKFPKHICVKCMEALFRYYEFWKKCRESIDILNKVIFDNISDNGSTKEVRNNDVDYSNFIVLETEVNKDLPNLATDVIDESVDDIIEYSIESTDNTTITLPITCLKCKIKFYSKDHFALHSCKPFEDITNKEKDKSVDISMLGLDSNIDCIDDIKLPTRCTKCKIKFYTKKHFLNHNCKILSKLRSMANVKSTGRKTIKKNTIKKNVKLVQPRKVIRCTKCNIKFYSRFHLQNHVCRQKIQKNITCKHCSKVFPNPHLKKKHELEVHSNLNPYTCDICSKTFIYPLSLESHKRTHFCAEPFKCTICDKLFKTRLLLSAHKLEHGVKHRHTCPLCDEGYDKYTKLKRHLKEVHPMVNFDNKQNQQPFICKECGNSFTTNKSLEEHTRTIHFGKDEFPCTICGKKFRSKSYLRGHMLIHSTENKYVCQHCGKKCKTWSMRNVHIKIHHSDERPYVCHICAKGFKFSGRLKIHLRQHNNDKPYACDQCSMAFVSSSRLKDHQKVHQKNGRFVCSICFKAFNANQYLKHHMLTHDNKLYECTVCLRTYKQAYYYEQHMKSHTTLAKKDEEAEVKDEDNKNDLQL